MKRRKTFLALATITIPLLVSPVMVSCNKIEQNDNETKIKNKNKSIKFDGKTFDSIDSFKNYISQEIDKTKQTVVEKVYSSNNDSFENSVNYRSLRKIKSDRITELTNGLIQMSLQEYKERVGIDGKLDAQTANQIIFDNNSNNNYITIYKGLNDTVHRTEESAKKSFLNANLYYQYKGKFYATTLDIENKILSDIKKINEDNADLTIQQEKLREYFNLTQHNKPIELPNGSLYNVTKENITNIIENNLRPFVKFDDKYIPFSELESTLNDLISDDDLNIIKYTSTQGKRSFMIDGEADRGNLYGKYIHNTTGRDIYDITNPEAWNKTSDPDLSSMVKTSTYQKIVNQFMTMVLMFTENKESIVDKQAYETQIQQGNYFNILNNNQFKKEIDEAKKHLMNITVYEDLNSISLWQKLLNIIKINQKGTKSGVLNQISLTYKAGLAYLVKAEADIDSVNSFRNLYRKILSTIDFNMESIFNNIEIEGVNKVNLYISQDRKPISLLNIIMSDEFDITSDFTFFINIIANSPILVNAITVFNAAMNNGSSAGGVYEYGNGILEKNDLKFLDNKITKAFKSLFDFYSIKEDNPYYLFNKNTGYYQKIKEHENNVKSGILNGIVHYANKVTDAIAKMSSAFSDPISDTTQIFKDKEYEKYKNFVLANVDKIGSNGAATFNVRNLAKADIVSDPSFGFQNWNGSNVSKNVLNINSINAKYEQFKKSKANKIDAATKTSLKALAVTPQILKEVTNIFSLLSSVGDKNFDWKRGIQEGVKSYAKMVQTAMAFIPPEPTCKAIALGVTIVCEILIQGMGDSSTVFYEFQDNSGSDVTKYYWDGGQQTSRFWGLWVNDDYTIKDAKIQKPIEIMPSFVEEGYYFNGKKYSISDKHKIKRDAIIAFKNNTNIFNNTKHKIEIVYSLENNINQERINKFGFENLFYKNTTTAINNLSKDFETKQAKLLKIYATNKSVVNSISFNNEQDKTLILENNIKSIFKLIKEKLAHLKPIIVIQVPKIRNNKYKLADLYESVDSVIKKLNKENNNFKNELLYIDLNQNDFSPDDIDQNILENNYVAKFIDNNFLKSFVVESKLVYIGEFLKHDNYSEIKNEMVPVNLFMVRNKNGKINYFSTFEYAADALECGDYMDIKSKKVNKFQYYYKNIQSNNKKEIMDILINTYFKDANNE